MTGEPKAYWRAIASEVRTALDGADLNAEVDTPMGKRTVADRRKSQSQGVRKRSTVQQNKNKSKQRARSRRAHESK